MITEPNDLKDLLEKPVAPVTDEHTDINDIPETEEPVAPEPAEPTDL